VIISEAEMLSAAPINYKRLVRGDAIALLAMHASKIYFTSVAILA
jgi:hypothetical protein